MLGWKTCQTFQSDINDATEHYYKICAQTTTARHGFCSNMFFRLYFSVFHYILNKIFDSSSLSQAD